MSTAQPRLLVIDNDERIAFYLKTLFTKRGYAVYAAQGFGAALRENAITLARQVRPHVAIIDLRLDDDFTDEPTGLLLLPDLDSTCCILYSAYLAPTVLSRVKRQYSVFDWVDKQDIERLFVVVDEAASQTNAGRRQLQIQWPDSWQRAELIQALFNEAPTQPEVYILDDIVAQLFKGNARILLETLNNAADAPRSVARGRSVVAKVYPDHLQPMVLKLGHARRTRREYTNYQEYIHNQLPGLFYTHVEKHVAFWDLGGTIYSFVGAGQQVMPTFAIHYARTTAVDTILSPLYHLFCSVWQPHYAAAVPMEAPSLLTAYQEIFQLEEKLARIDPHLIEKLQAQLTRPLVDPVQWVRTSGEQSAIAGARQAVTHGDLHGDNLFVEEDHAWIIDFERTGPSHALRDFAELEMDIFARLLPQSAIEWATLYQLARLLVEPTAPDMPLAVDPLLAQNPEIEKARQTISRLRHLAHGVVQYSDQREHLWALLFDALFVASVTAMPETQRLRALLYGSVICQRLADWPHH